MPATAAGRVNLRLEALERVVSEQAAELRQLRHQVEELRGKPAGGGSPAAAGPPPAALPPDDASGGLQGKPRGQGGKGRGEGDKPS